MISARWKRNVEPPSLPSKLVALALRDLEWVEKHPEYTICMESWVNGCHVCFAGAIMVRRFHSISGCGPSHYSGKWNDAFYALNSFRQGDIKTGLERLNIYREFRSLDIIYPYWVDPVAFKRCMRDVITFLQEEGL